MATQANLTIWKYTFYTDISSQLRRLGLSNDNYDGLLLRKDLRIGSWLQNELKLKHFELGNERDSASVLVSRSGIKEEPWKLEWHFQPNGYGKKFYSMSTLPVSTRSETLDLPRFLENSP